MLNYHWHPSDRTLTRLIDAELTGRRRTNVEHHLTRCARCAAQLRALSSASRLVEALTIPEVQAPSEDCAALRARVQARLSVATVPEHTPRSEERTGSLRTPFALLGGAGLIVIAALGSPLRQSTRAGMLPETLSSRTGSGMLPDASLTPGSVEQTAAAELCGAGPRPHRRIAPSVREAVLRAYGMEHVPPGEYELDYLITPELGGGSDRENVWPERYGSRVWNARVKDDLERLLPQMVCEGRLDLAIAQHDIAVDWIAAYKKYFHTSAPLTTYGSASDDDDPVVVASSRLAAQVQLARR